MRDHPYRCHVPTIHKSISGDGTDDLAYTKPNLIRQLLGEHRKPVLYLDADCEFMSEPELIDELVASRCDFAVYNWCSGKCAEVFVPIDLGPRLNEPTTGKRFYRVAGSFGWYTDDQLICSGLVQLYRNSLAGCALLRRWQETIAKFPDCPDDGALAFTFNNLTRRSWLS